MHNAYSYVHMQIIAHNAQLSAQPIAHNAYSYVHTEQPTEHNA